MFDIFDENSRISPALSKIVTTNLGVIGHKKSTLFIWENE
jgi:hypothetical protein